MVVETRDGSGNLVQQFIHGTQYIDELVMVRTKDKGDLYYHQDANWNVIAMTDLAGRVVERWLYTPYGEPTVHEDSGYGDRDGDGDVDSTDKGTVGVDCTGTVSGSCRVVDLDFDGDYDSTDATKFDALPSGIRRQPGRQSSGLSQPFAHQGLVYDAEIGSYQNRPRQYAPGVRRFLQREPLWGIGYLDGMDPYVYLRGNPVAFVDPSGALALAAKENWCDCFNRCQNFYDRCFDWCKTTWDIDCPIRCDHAYHYGTPERQQCYYGCDLAGSACKAACHALERICLKLCDFLHPSHMCNPGAE